MRSPQHRRSTDAAQTDGTPPSACPRVLRHSSDKVTKLEASVDHYKKKLEDLGLLRRQVPHTYWLYYRSEDVQGIRPQTWT